MTYFSSLLFFYCLKKDDGKIFWSGYWNSLDKKSVEFSEEIKIEDVVSFSCGHDQCLFLKSKNTYATTR